MPQLLNADHIAAPGGGFEPQRKYNGTIFVNVPKGVPNSSGAMDTIRLALRKAPIPKPHTSIEKIPFGNTERKFPGRTTYDDLEVSFTDYIDKDVAGLFIEWHKLVFNVKNGGTGLAKDIKTMATYTLFGPNDAEGYQRSYSLHGVWPASIDYGEIDMESTGPNIIGVTFAMDWFEPSNESIPLYRMGRVSG
jgi:hypothetical protein